MDTRQDIEDRIIFRIRRTDTREVMQQILPVAGEKAYKAIRTLYPEPGKPLAAIRPMTRLRVVGESIAEDSVVNAVIKAEIKLLSIERLALERAAWNEPLNFMDLAAVEDTKLFLRNAWVQLPLQWKKETEVDDAFGKIKKAAEDFGKPLDQITARPVVPFTPETKGSAPAAPAKVVPLEFRAREKNFHSPSDRNGSVTAIANRKAPKPSANQIRLAVVSNLQSGDLTLPSILMSKGTGDIIAPKMPEIREAIVSLLALQAVGLVLGFDVRVSMEGNSSSVIPREEIQDIREQLFIQRI